MESAQINNIDFCPRCSCAVRKSDLGGIEILYEIVPVWFLPFESSSPDPLPMLGHARHPRFCNDNLKKKNEGR